jgi:EmrB/QacA subfamily drug resistance transporter
MAQERTATSMPRQMATGPASEEHNPWLILIVLCTAIFMLLLDTTIVNVAQVEIKDALGANLTQIQWVLDSYILTYAVLLLSFGRLGDVYGRKKLFMLGMAIFTGASALCAASAWIGDQVGVSAVSVLVTARVLQGVGGAFMMPQTLSLLTVSFPPEKRGAALGIWGSVTALGAVLGPIIGGLIVTNYAWEWVFLINLPVGIFAILATRRIIPESADPQASGRLDWGGLFLSGFGIFALVFACIEASKRGWTDSLILGLLAGSAVLLTVFVLWERRVADPMMKLELFRIRNFWVGNVIALTVAFGMLGIFFPMTLFLQEILGFSPIRAGLTMTPMSLTIMIAAPFAGRMTDRIGARWLLVTGLTLMSGGILFIISRISLETTWVRLLPALLVTGAGMGMTFAPMTAAAMKEVPPRIAGSASGILNTTRNVGQVLGIAILGSFLQTRVAVHTEERLARSGADSGLIDQVVRFAKQSQMDRIASIVPADQMGIVFQAIRSAFVESIHNTFLVGAIACMVAAVTALLIHNPERAGAREAERAKQRPAIAAD